MFLTLFIEEKYKEKGSLIMAIHVDAMWSDGYNTRRRGVKIDVMGMATILTLSGSFLEIFDHS